MIERVIDWLGRRHAAIHRADETARAASERIARAESAVAGQRRDGQQAAVNLIYDRITVARSRTGKTHG